MTKEEFVAQLDRAVAVTPHLPVSSAILKHVSDRLKGGEPPWWKPVAQAWEKRQFHGWMEAWWLFLTCVHYEALSDAQSPLVPFFPSCGGTDEADPTQGIVQFLKDPPKTFFKNLKDGERRTFGEVWATLPKVFFDKRATYDEAWGPLWFRPAMTFFQNRRLPYYLVEINAGAGLNLAMDLAMPPKGFEADLVAARIGTDSSPLQAEDINQRRWLTAGIPPEQLPLIGVMDDLIDAVRERQKKDAAFIQLVECKAEAAPQFVAKNIPADDPDVGLLLLTIGVTSQMGDAEYAKFGRAIYATMTPWADRALWVEFDKVREEIYSTTYQLRVHRVVDGKEQTCVIARFDMGFGQIRSQQLIQIAKQFLSVETSRR